MLTEKKKEFIEFMLSAQVLRFEIGSASWMESVL